MHLLTIKLFSFKLHSFILKERSEVKAMFIADVSLEYVSFRGVPLYSNKELMTFVSDIPFYVDGVIARGELLTVPKSMVKTYKTVSRIHPLERFSILHILDESQKLEWKLTIEHMFRDRGKSVASFLEKMNIEELLVFFDLWEAGDILVEEDMLLHHDDNEGLLQVDMRNVECQQDIHKLLENLVKETKIKEKQGSFTFEHLKEQFQLNLKR